MFRNHNSHSLLLPSSSRHLLSLIIPSNLRNCTVLTQILIHFLIFSRQFKASVWSYNRSQGLADDDNEEEDPSLLYDLDPHSSSDSPQADDDTTFHAADTQRPVPSGRGRGTRDSLAAVRARAQMRAGAGGGRGNARGPLPVDDTYDEDGDTTANITAMPLPGTKRR